MDQVEDDDNYEVEGEEETEHIEGEEYFDQQEDEDMLQINLDHVISQEEKQRHQKMLQQLQNKMYTNEDSLPNEASAEM